MTATGNYKKPVKPKDLYTPLEDRLAKQKKATEPTKSVEELRAELMETFGLTDDDIAKG